MNKATAELRELAAQYSKKAIAGLVKIAQESESDSARVAAWREVLDRYAGRPAQAVTGEDGAPLVFPDVLNVVIKAALGADNRT